MSCFTGFQTGFQKNRNEKDERQRNACVFRESVAEVSVSAVSVGTQALHFCRTQIKKGERKRDVRPPINL